MKKGISLIVLIVTIIVMLILAVTIIMSVTGDDTIDKASSAIDETNYKTIQEALEVIVLNGMSKGDSNILSIKQDIEKNIEGATVTNFSDGEVAITDQIVKVTVINNGKRYQFTVSLEGIVSNLESYALTEEQARAQGWDWRAGGFFSDSDISATMLGKGGIYGYTGNDKNVVIPYKIGDTPIEFVAMQAFQSKNNIRLVVIPEGVKAIDASAFSYCANLEWVILPNSLKIVGALAFNSCSKLASVILPNGLTKIGEYAFYRTRLNGKLTIAGGVQEIGDCAFINTNLSEVVIEKGVATIGISAFGSCVFLSKITIPSSVTTIGQYAFSSCTSLSEITIPSNVTVVEEEIFGYWTDDQTINVAWEEGNKPAGWSVSWKRASNATVNYGVN